jgi:hypothetical protein
LKITIDLKELISIGLSPSEYVVMLLVESNELMNYPVFTDKLVASLIDKGWLDTNKKVIRSLNIKERIDEWLDLWPTFIIPQNYRISGNYRDCKDRMDKFIKKYGYSWDIIIEATRSYLKRQEANNWNMTKKNMKFIYDTDGSMLAEECEVVINGEGEENKANQQFI